MAHPENQTIIARTPPRPRMAEQVPSGAEFRLASADPSAMTSEAPPARGTIEIPQQSDDAIDLAGDGSLPPVRVKPVVHRSREEVCDTLAKAAANNNLPAPFFIRLLFQESGFKPGVVSRAGAEGIAQFMPETSASMGLQNPFDPLQAIPASARLLRSLFQQFGNLGLAAAAYNAGPKRIQDWLAKKGKLPQETQGYVKTITGQPAESWKVASAGNASVKLPRHAPCQEIAGLYAWDGPEAIPMPPPSPRTQAAANEASARIVKTARIARSTAKKIAAAKKSPAFEVASIVKPEISAKPHHGKTRTSKVAAQPPAAHSQKPAKMAQTAPAKVARAAPAKHKNQKVAQK